MNHNTKSFAVMMIAAIGLCSAGLHSTHAGDLLGDIDPLTIERHKAQDTAQATRERLAAEEAEVNARLATIQQKYFTSNLADLRDDAAALGAQPDEAKLRERASVKTEKSMALSRELAKKQLDGIAADRAKNEADLSDSIAELDKAGGNGEGERALRITYAFLNNRWENSKREVGPDAQMLKFLADVSIADINKYGPLGGPNSEAHKLVSALDQHFRDQFEAAGREGNPFNVAVRGVTGISIGDIGKHGLFGGPNSDCRKVFKTLGLPW